MNKYRITEVLCVLLTLSFIFFSVNSQKKTDKSADELSISVINIMNDNSVIERNNNYIKENLINDISVFSSVSYYSSDDVMNVNELFIGVLNEKNNNDVFSVFEEYVNDKYNLFNGYAPEQASYLSSYILKNDAGTIFFCVGENAQDIYNEFKNNL